MNRLNNLFILSVGLLLVIGLWGCMDLDVTNPNQPDTERALASGDDIESLIGGSFLSFWNGTSKNYPAMTISVMAGGITSSWGNFGMLDLGRRPREPFNNSPAYADIGMVNTPWFNLYGANSSVSDGLLAMNLGIDIGPAGERNARARAFARFIQGITHGYIALHFDQGFIYDETIDLTEVELELVPYTEIMDAAIGYLEEAIEIANANTFETPSSWINQRPITNTELAALAHSMIARLLAQVARTPEERAAVDWGRVITHAEQGIQENFTVHGDGVFWWNRLHSLAIDEIWARTSYYTVGYTDQSGQFEAWLADDVNDRREFIMEPADDRIGTEVIDPDDIGFTNVYPLYAEDGIHYALTVGSYFAVERGRYFYSRYMHTRYWDFYAAGYVGRMMLMLATELDLLIAEGEIRRNGDLGRAAELINRTRVDNGGLEPATAGDGAEALLEMMKYEHRLETLNSFMGVDYYTRRGWGELPDGTLLHFPVPPAELDILELPNYTHGGNIGDVSNWNFPKLDPMTLDSQGGPDPRRR